MTLYSTAVFLAVPGVLWAAFCYIFPAVARARFVRTIEEIHDALDDAVIAQKLPDAEPVRELLALCDLMCWDAKSLSISTLWAVDRSRRELPAGSPLRHGRASYSRLTREQRKMMHEFDAQITDALGVYLVTGSKLAVPMIAAALVLRHSKRWNKRWKSSTEAPHPSQLAHNFVKVPTTAPRKITHPHAGLV